MDTNDIRNIQKLLAPYGINLIRNYSVDDDLIFTLIVPKDSKIKKNNRYIKGEYARKFTINTISKYTEERDIHISFGFDTIQSDLTWTLDNKTDVDMLLRKF